MSALERNLSAVRERHSTINAVEGHVLVSLEMSTGPVQF